MSAAIVDRVARHVYAARGHTRPTWERLSEFRRTAYLEMVQEVLLAAMNAGLIIREMGEGGGA